MGHVHIGDFEQVEGKDPSVTELPHWQSLIDHLKVKGGDFLKALRVFLNMFVKKFNILFFLFNFSLSRNYCRQKCKRRSVTISQNIWVRRNET